MQQEELDAYLRAAPTALPAAHEMSIRGSGPVFSNRYKVDEMAATALLLEGSAAAELWRIRSGQEQKISVDVRSAAAFTAATMLDQINHQPPQRYSNYTTSLYKTRDDRWIHLHGGLPHLHAGTLQVLKCDDDPGAVARAVARRDAQELEDELAASDMCGVVVRSTPEWREHPHGRLVTRAPLVELVKLDNAQPRDLPDGNRPLAGVRVLEFARILAAPIVGRTLASHGAGVLNIASRRHPGLFECEISTGWGKRSAFLDMTDVGDMAQVKSLAGTADVFINGYRPGALDKRGLGPHELASANPGLVYVSINCYGHDGPWAERRGWEQLSQAVSGLMLGQGRDAVPIRMPATEPGQKVITTTPTDSVTGVLGAYGAMVALARRAEEGGSWWVRVSLCQTAAWFERCGQITDPGSAPGFGDVADLCATESSEFGDITHLAPVVALSRTPAYWAIPPSALGAQRAEWA